MKSKFMFLWLGMVNRKIKSNVLQKSKKRNFVL